MRRAISAFVAFLLALWAAFVVRFTNGIPVLWSLLFVLCPVVCVSDEPSPYPDAGIVRVMARGDGGQSFGHACPVTPTLLLTARHVGARGPVTWDDLSGNSGRAETLRQDDARDISVLKVTQGRVGVTFAIATKPPAVGEQLYVVGYDNAADNPLKPKVVAVKVLGVMAGHVFFKRSPGPGSSGSCVLNAQREVVTINSSFAEATGMGVGVGVWGPWAISLEEKSEASQITVAKDPDEGS